MNIADISNLSSACLGGESMNAVSGASPYVPATPTGTDPLLEQLRSDIQQNSQDFKALKSSLKSNDLAGATQAFNTLQQDIQNASQTAGGQSLFDSNSPIGKDFSALGKALQSGDLSGAKQAFAAFRQDMKRAGHAARAQQQPSANDGDGDDGAPSLTLNPTATARSASWPALGSSLNATA